jgi:hypothetical protein
MSGKSIFAKLHDGKGFEWYHLLIVALVVGFLAHHNGVKEGLQSSTNCDTLSVILDNKEFTPTFIQIHPCDSIEFTNKDNSDYVVQDATNQTIFKINEGDTYTEAFNEKNTFFYHTDKWPSFMTIKIEVE